jgi:polar amino acid transport system substrate-binding protein
MMVVGIGPGGAAAQTEPPTEPAVEQIEGPVRVAVRLREPFVIRNDDGTYRGFSVELAQEIARRGGVELEFVEVPDVRAQLAAVQSGDADVAIGAISITAERERSVDFSQPMFESGIQIGIADVAVGSSFTDILRNVVSPGLLTLLVILLVATLLAGTLIWLLERRRNEHFGERGWAGFFDGIWWATVTLFTIGYGDKVPSRVASRIVTIFWMLFGVLLVATLTAEVTSSLTIERIEANITSVGDLYDRDVVTIEGTTSEAFLRANGIDPALLTDSVEAFRAVAEGEYDAIVFDRAILEYLLGEIDGVRLAGGVLKPESYGIAFPNDSPVVELVNQALLELREDGTYDRLREVYFGG